MKHIITAVISVLLGCNVLSAGAGPTVEFTEALGPLSGEGAQMHPDNLSPHKADYYGTDLGFSYEHNGMIHFLFGDTWAVESYAPIEKSTGSEFDDMYGTIEIDKWPDPAKITPDNMPLIKLGQIAGTSEVDAMDPGHAMDLGKTPMAGFSNGEDEYAIFNITKPRGCVTDADCSGLVCDTGLGYTGTRYDVEEEFTAPCFDGTPSCSSDPVFDGNDKPVADSGLCVSGNSTVRGDGSSAPGRVAATALRVTIGKRSRTDPGSYPVTREWLSNKFLNVTASTVQKFVPADGPGHKNQDYSIAGKSGPDRRVLLWGRPGFAGIGATGRSLGLYFAYVDMPSGEELEWEVHYYTGTDGNGVPQFSPRQADAAPADLDSTHPGIQPGEAHDMVNQMSIVWIDHIKKWVMFYSGGMQTFPKPGLPKCGLLQAFSGSECRSAVIGNHSVRMRTADHPWGPWTPPQDILVVGSPDADPVGGEFAPGGMLNHPDCTTEGCAPSTDTPFYTDMEYGFYYSPNIVEQWIKPVGEAVDVIWNASTWDPYRVVLLRTRIKP